MKDSQDTLSQDQLLAELGWISALARRLVTDPNVADDVLQRVCLVALEKPPRHVSGAVGIRRWLSTLTRRMAAHSMRSERRRARRERHAARSEVLPPTVSLVERREVLHQLVDSLTALEASDQELLTLRYFEGLGVGELAARLELSEGAVRQRLLRARNRLRARLEKDAGSGSGSGSGTGTARERASERARTRWLAALGPVMATPAALTTHVTLASRAELARQATQTTLSNPIGVAAMTKVASALSVKVALGVALVAAAVIGSWQLLDEPSSAQTMQPTSLSRVDAARAPDAKPTPLPVVPEAPRAAPRPLAVAMPDDLPSEDEPDATPPMPSNLTLALDEATVSFVTMNPDLEALNRVLRQLAQAARVVPDSVSKNPSDGSVNGWVEIEGTELKAEWSLSASGNYSLKFGMVEGDYPDPFVLRDLGLRFSDDHGHAGDVKTHVQFHPNTSEANFDSLLDSLNDGAKPVGWSLSVGPQGTTGTPSIMHISEDRNSVVIMSGGSKLPGFTHGWANDTSAYDLWLSVLAGSTH